MILTLKVLNDDATLNNWEDLGGTVQIVRGSDVKLILQLFQVERKIRYIPIDAAVITVALLKSDQTTITKTASFPFADDRSIIEFDLSAAETAVLIGQNLAVMIVEDVVTNIAVLQQGLQIISPMQTGC